MVLKHDRKTLGHAVVIFFGHARVPSNVEGFRHSDADALRGLFGGTGYDRLLCQRPGLCQRHQRAKGRHAHVFPAHQSGGHGWPKRNRNAFTAETRSRYRQG